MESFFWTTDDTTEGGHWTSSGTTDYEYNAAGLVTVSVSSYERSEFAYDSQWRLVSETHYSVQEGQEPTPWSKRTFAYDTKVTNLVVSEDTYTWQNGDWALVNSERSAISRNDAGNITKIVTSSTWDGTEWHDDSMLEVTYGADGKANTIKESYLEDGTPEVEVYLTDIVWDRTDGQIVIAEFDDSDFFTGPNRIKSAKALKEYTYPYAGDIIITAEYNADGGYTSKAMMNNELYSSTVYEVLDNYGSYKQTDFSIDYDYDDVNDTYVPDDQRLDEYGMVYDAYGLVLKEYEVSYIDGDKANGMGYNRTTTGTVTYDSEKGYPIEYITANSYDGEEPQNQSRTIFSDYYDVIAAGIDNVEAEANAPVEYFTLQGMPVKAENLSAGIYIRRQGGKVSKVAVR